MKKDSKQKIAIFVEGDDDKRYFELVLRKELENIYEISTIQTYQKNNKVVIIKKLKSYKESNNQIIFFRDINSSPCVTFIKSQISELYELKSNEIIIVVKKIEGWYLAGLTQAKLKEYGIIGDTNNVGKGAIKKIVGKIYKNINKFSEASFKQDLLTNYDINEARKNNKSFNYFYNKYFTK